jgi:hypothetical protein
VNYSSPAFTTCSWSTKICTNILRFLLINVIFHKFRLCSHKLEFVAIFAQLTRFFFVLTESNIFASCALQLSRQNNCFMHLQLPWPLIINNYKIKTIEPSGRAANGQQPASGAEGTSCRIEFLCGHAPCRTSHSNMHGENDAGIEESHDPSGNSDYPFTLQGSLCADFTDSSLNSGNK